MSRKFPSEDEVRADKGAIIVEFAIILPILLILVFGIIEFGRGYNSLISLQSAAREGVRVLALADTLHDADTRDDVEAAVKGWANISVDSIAQTPCTVDGGQARVVVTRNFRLNIPFLPSGASNFNLTGDASMRCGL